MAKIGPLLQQTLARIESVPASERVSVISALSARLGIEDGGRLPTMVQRRQPPPKPGETFEEYRHRVDADLQPLNDAVTGGSAQHLILSNSVCCNVSLEQVSGLADLDQIDMLELNPVYNAAQMDQAFVQTGIPALRTSRPDLKGTGIKVALLDSGIDTSHPHLKVHASVSTSGEDVSIPGLHATHCAGSLASRDETFPGIAPDVTLFNIKVLRHTSRGSPANIARGVDEALAFGADILSISLGYNHLPTWSDRGHGWFCPDGNCVLCTAIDNATFLGAIVVAAAGNEHQRAEALRRFGASDSFDTEMTCPGQSRTAISVAAVTKHPFLPAEFSSRGPTAYGASKPVFCCPGVNITSTAPVPRQSDGSLVANPNRTDLFATDSGTSMATPIVAGALALVMQDRRDQGLDTSRDAILQAVRGGALEDLGVPETVLGEGRIDMSSFPLG